MTRVRVNQAQVNALKHDPGVARGTLTVGQKVAIRAGQNAPKASGEGAASIAAEEAPDERGAVVRVSWGPYQFYMFFHELGTSRMRARPFLRPALGETYTI